MDDIRRQDQRLLVRELLSAHRIILSGMGLVFFLGLWLGAGMPFTAWVVMTSIIVLTHGLTSYQTSLKKRFLSKRYENLWQACLDRLKLFEEVQERVRKDKIGGWQELPKTIERVAKSLYCALRRADMISHEVALTEKGLYSQPPPWAAPSHDPQAKELYRVADKNIAEYRNQFASVMAGVHRTEAQCAVFMTTVDTLRMKMIGYRLVGRSPEMSSQDFLEAMSEAKLQLAAIDHALEELELAPFPKTISILPPIPPDQAAALEQISEDQNP